MKKLIVVFVIFFAKIAIGCELKNDTNYYLLDTIKTAPHDRMWEVYNEYPSLKICTIRCPCLTYNSEPTFVCDQKHVKKIAIAADKIKNISFISLSNLVTDVKKFINSGYGGPYEIYMVEPERETYTIYKVRLIRPIKPQIMN